MVIQCTQCDTRFRIADEKLKPGGIKVRCSKCRHIFTVMPPEPQTPAPPPPAEDEIDFGDFNMKPVPEEPTSSGAVSEPDLTEREKSEETGPSETDFEEESTSKGPADFDFKEESPATGRPAEFDIEEEFSAEQGPAEFDFEPPSPEGSEFDFEEDTTPDQGAVEFGFEDDSPDDSMEFSFEDTDPFSDTDSEYAGAVEKGAGAPEDFDFGDEKNETADIDDFDLSGMSFGDEAPPAEPRGEDFGNIPLEQAPEIEDTSATPTDSKKSGKPAGGEKKTAALPASPPRKGPFKGLMMFVLVLLLVLCGVAGYFFWQRGNLDIAKIVEQITGQGAPTAVTGQIRLSELSSSFITNREAGQLFVIHGKATNDFSEIRSAIAVKGILYNNNGKALLQQTVFCGNPLNEDDLRKMPFASIEERMNNQFGDSLSNLNVDPGKSIPFTIVFHDLPQDLAEYTVETVDSKPGSKP